MADASWKLNELEYLESPAASVMAFHDFYPEGHQGGVTIIHHGERVGACGDLRVTTADGQHLWKYEKCERQVDADGPAVIVPVTKRDSDFTYTVTVRAEGESVRLTVDLAEPLAEGAKAEFSMEFYPPAFWGLTWHVGGAAGVFPREPGQPLGEPLGEGSRIVLAPEAPERKLTIEGVGCRVALLDPRKGNEESWFIVRTRVPFGVTERAVEWLITPNRIPGWRREPVICVSQIGYHPDQPKRALIEFYPDFDGSAEVVLSRVDADGGLVQVSAGRPERGGKFMRHEYGVFDFSDVRKPGVYMLRCGDRTAGPFRIAPDVYAQGVWQPTLGTYFPVQMCHVEVWDGGRCWHGACHMDDALQAPNPHVHFDGYAQGETTDTPYRPQEHVPHLDIGGWHDAGDTDLAAGSQAQTTMWLALAHEEFGIDLDETTVNVQCRLGGYRAVGHSFCGIIAGNTRHYYQRGSISDMTDNLVYDASLAEDERTGDRAGRNDDRWVFTNRDTSQEYQVAAALAASGRVLRGHDDALADECIEAASKAWAYEQEHEPVRHRTTYVPGRPEAQEVLATAQLLLTTGEAEYADRLKQLVPAIEQYAGDIGWATAKALAAVDDAGFSAEVRRVMEAHAARLEEDLAGNPFGVLWGPDVWGEGWKLQNFAVRYYFLARAFPDLFDPEPVYSVVNFVLGCHPGSNVSFVSAVGPESLTIAFGINRADYSFIAGGMAAGTALIRPDFPELKADTPFLWQQTEYVMPGAATYIFSVLAAQSLLDTPQSSPQP